MSMIEQQVNELRKLADISGSYGEMIIKQAADTIEALSAKLAKENMERSERYYNDGWILCSDRLPENSTEIVLVCLKNGVVSVAICPIDGEFINMIVGASAQKIRVFPERNLVIAWQPLPEPYKHNEWRKIK